MNRRDELSSDSLGIALRYRDEPSSGRQARLRCRPRRCDVREIVPVSALKIPRSALAAGLEFEAYAFVHPDIDGIIRLRQRPVKLPYDRWEVGLQEASPVSKV